MGFCLGGLLAYLMASRSTLDCSVGYYGVGIERYLDELSNITHPLMLHVAGQDEFCGPEARALLQARIGHHRGAEVHVYAGARHAFARGQGRHYDAPAARLADGRTEAFFAAHLKGA